SPCQTICNSRSLLLCTQTDRALSTMAHETFSLSLRTHRTRSHFHNGDILCTHFHYNCDKVLNSHPEPTEPSLTSPRTSCASVAFSSSTLQQTHLNRLVGLFHVNKPLRHAPVANYRYAGQMELRYGRVDPHRDRHMPASTRSSHGRFCIA